MGVSGSEVHTCCEDTVETDRAANPLGQNELIVLVAQGCHHNAKYMEKGAKDEKVAGAMVIEKEPNNRTLRNQLRTKLPGKLLTGKNITKISQEGIQATVLGEYSRSW